MKKVLVKDDHGVRVVELKLKYCDDYNVGVKGFPSKSNNKGPRERSIWGKIAENYKKRGGKK